jgi:hypothetical protein
MVSIGPNSQAYDFRQMYDFSDLRSTTVTTYIPKDSIAGFIFSNPDTTLFAKIVKKANLMNILSDIQANFTIFVASDKELLQKGYDPSYFDKIDISEAKNILNFSMMHRKIDQGLIQSSPSSKFPTLDRSNSMYITTLCGITLLPGDVKVIHYNQPANNGIIHITDNLLYRQNATTCF